MSDLLSPPIEVEPLEFGDVTEPQQWPPIKTSLVVASYNIRYARGPFLISGGVLRKLGMLPSRQRTRTISENVQAAARAFTDGKLLPSVDILALQEADKRTVRSGGVHVARELASAMRMSWVHAPAGIPRGVKPVQREWWLDFEEPIQLFDEGDTGVSLISRYSLSSVTRIDLPWKRCLWRPRVAVAASIRLRDTDVRVVSVHVDPHAASNGQLEQLEVITQHAAQSKGPAVILGDFNTLSKQKCSDTRQFLEDRGYTTPMPTGTATWRGAGLRLHADWIFTRDLTISRWGVARPLNVSDHWPVWAEIEVPAE
ncbi:MAG TPA: endonuclease/exonuclease/phosphatase family protein [Pyrinomonadaceae bacterium]